MFVALRRIHVAASDFHRSRRFYGETLGLPEGSGFEDDWVEFALGPVLIKLTPLRPGEVPARNQVALVLSTDSLDTRLATLKERGVTVTRGPIDEFTGRSAEILDPDGYRIVVFQPSDLHPDEEWVPMSRIDETIKLKLLAKKQKGKFPPRQDRLEAKKAAEAKKRAEARARFDAAKARDEARRAKIAAALEAKRLKEERKKAELKARLEAKKASEVKKKAERKAKLEASRAAEAKRRAELKAKLETKKAAEAKRKAELKVKLEAKLAAEKKKRAEAKAADARKKAAKPPKKGTDGGKSKKG